MKLILILLLLISIFFVILLINNKETFSTNKECIKDEDKTKITLIEHRWTKDFESRFKNHERYSNKKMKELLPKLPNNSYIIDVGSHVGDTGLYLALLLKNKWNSKNIKVIMIDPDSTKLEFIDKMSKINNLDNIILKNYGVSDKSGKSEIIKKHHPGGWKIKENSGSISMDTLDNICKNKNISMLHIDVEGMEYKTLLGSKNIIKNVKYILIELNHITKRNKERDFLNENNFTEIINKKINEENGNCLFERKM